MLRITELAPAQGAVHLRLEGRLVGPWVSEAKQVCDRKLDHQRPLVLDLKDLAFVDLRGAVLLAQLRQDGAQLLNGSPFLEAQLRAVGESGDAFV